MKIKYILLISILTLLLTNNTNAADRFWVSGAGSNWNNVANWSTLSGGAGGASVPGIADQIFFDANGIGNCNIDIAVNIESLQIPAGYTGIIDLNGNLFTINGATNNIFTGGTINDTPTTSSLSLTSTGTTTFSGTIFNTDVVAASDRLYFSGSTFNIASSFTKTGAGNDNSNGGNTFNQDMIFINNSINYLLLGNGTADIFNGNVTFTNNGSQNMYLAHSGAGHTITGNLTLINNATGPGDYRMFVCAVSTASLTINGNVLINQNGNATTVRTYFADNGDITLNGKLTATVGGSGTTSDIRIANGTNSLVTISDTLSITNNGSATNTNSYIGEAGSAVLSGKVNLINSGTGTTSQILVANNTASAITVNGVLDVINNNTATTTNRIYLGNQGDVTFNNELNILNNAGSLNSEIFCNYQVNSNNIYNENITVSSTNTNCDGIFFGQNTGSGILANNKTITIPGIDIANFIGGRIFFRNFTQTGATAQSLELASTASYIYSFDSDWGGNIDFRAPRILSNGTTYNGTTYLEKTGAGGNDASTGGNTFVGDLTLVNSGSNYLLLGNGTADIFQANVDLINSGSHNLYIAHNGPGHMISGNLTSINSASGPGDYRVYCGTSVSSTLTIIGNVTLNNTGNAATLRTYVANEGDITLNGTLTINNSGTGTNSYMHMAEGTNSSITTTGLTTVNNNNTAITTNRVYLGNNGDITFNGALDIVNNSGVTNSEVFCNYTVNSQNIYNENISVSSTNINCDGISFGQNNGSGILAATKNIAIPGIDIANFIGGSLYFRNFTQTGPTPHSFELASTALFVYNYDSDWGGDVDFRAPRMYTRGTNYNGTSHLEKTGGIGDDAGPGGNTFTGNLTLVNSGSRYLMTGNGTADSFQANVNLINSGSHNLYIAQAGPGHIISGNLTSTNSATGPGDYRVFCAGTTNSTLTINGNVTLNNTGNATTLRTYFANQGGITLNGALTINNSGIGTNSYIQIADATSSLITISGLTTVNNNNTASTLNRVYLGNSGDITFDGALDIVNNSGVTNSEIYCNYAANSQNIYNENITVSSTNVNSDGISFGQNNGSGILAATKTISIPGIDIVNFIGGSLYFRNFTQTGLTSHSFELASTAIYIYNYDSDWGGDVDFRSPRMYTRGTAYNGTSRLEKTGGIGNDAGPGGNTFVGNLTFANSGSNYIMTGNGTFDFFLADVNLLNTGTSHIYLAHNGAGHAITGDLTSTNSGTGNSGIYIGGATASTLSVNGNISLIQDGSGTTLYTYLGDQGDITANGTVTMLNTGTGTTSDMRIANNTNSAVSIAGATSIINSNSATTTNRVYLGNNGDIIFNGALDIVNNSGVTNSEVYCNYNTNSQNIYNENITVSSTNVNSDGIRFGQNNGSGTLAATKTISIPGIDIVNFVGGSLYFRNFTQTGPTPHSFELASTAIYVYNYDSDWGGDVDFRSPRMYTRGTTYNGTSRLEKTGGIGDDSGPGGNTFTGNLTLANSGSRYLMTGNGTFDIFLADVNLLNTGTNRIYLANNGAGHAISGDLTSTNSGTGNSSIYIGSGSASTLSVNGNISLIQDGSGTTLYTYLGDQGDITANGTVTMLNAGTGTTSDMRIANNTNSLVTISDTLSITNNGSATTLNTYIGNVGSTLLSGKVNLINSGTGTTSQILLANSAASTSTISGVLDVINNNTATTTNRIYLGNQGDVTFNNELNIVNNAGNLNSEVFCNYQTNSNNLYNENITLQTTNASSDGIRFGQNNGSGILAATKTITIGGGGFIAGELRFRNFTQTGATPQNLQPTGTTLFYNYDSQWNGNVEFRSPRHLTRGTTYNATAFLEKNGATNDASAGGNTFNADVTFQNTSTTGYFMPANGTPNDFNANALYIKTNNGLMHPGYNCINTYAGNITINSTTAIRFGAAGNGRTLFDGNTPQSINAVPGTPAPEFRDIQTTNTNNEITLNTPAIILAELDLDQGNIITTSTNLLYMNDNSIVSSVSNDAFIDGPLEKIGNDAFTFPVGDSSYYRPISMTNPGSGSARFRGEYFKSNPNPLYNRSLKDPSIDNVSACEYWLLDRISSTNNVSVTLSWGANTASCGITNISELTVSRWDGTMWKDHGNGGTTGTTFSGTIATLGPVTSFSPFTLGSTTANNPLPIELISFKAQLNSNVVDLTWQTASEINNDYFTLEKSEDGINWIAFSEQSGAGNSNVTINYSDFDFSPFLGISYYRLKQTDFNGAFEYSKIESINNNSSDIFVYPNPVKDYLTISGISEFHLVKVFASDGRIVYQGNTKTLNTELWSKGLYEVLILDNNNQIKKEFKIVK